jgi:outer membrane protein OmpA-like peptidoglycan-associated protein
MRARTLPVLFAATLLAGAAHAQQYEPQQFEPGQDVIVNPEAAAPLTLHRHAQEPIHLHRPGHHPHTAAKKRAAAPIAKSETETEPRAEAKTEAKPAPARQPKPAATPAPSNENFSFPGDISTGAPPPSLQQMTKTPSSGQETSRQEKSAKPAPAHTAKAAPAPAAGLTKHSMILFAPKATDPASDALGAIKFLASDLNAALANGSARIQIQAFGGPRGDKGTDARRLSLKRALSIRQILITDGVPADRIDVRAMGGASDGGPTDRVDVYIKS